MKKIFAIVTVSLFLSVICAPVITVSASEPQKKEAAKCEKKDCCKDAQKCDKKDCCKDAQQCAKKDCEKKACCDKKKAEKK